MGRISTGVPRIEHHLCISLRFLIDRGYIKSGQGIKGVITWMWGSKVNGSAGLTVFTEKDRGVLKISYTQNEVKKEKIIQMRAEPSNLGKGQVWYFICPHTAKRCRKLYMVGDQFGSRHLFGNMAAYNSQVRSKYERDLVPIPNEWPSKRPKYYAGKITKGYLKHLNTLEKAERSWYRVMQRLKEG